MAEVEVITAKQMEQFDKMLLSNPEMKTKVRKILSNVLSKVRSELSKEAKSRLSNDPRASYRAVKRTVYRRILGGSVSILAKRRASSTRVHVEHHSIYESEPHHRGGNRRARSTDTDRMDSYYGSDRGFILRFLNSGTKKRSTRYGNRGTIESRNWFGNSSHRLMEQYSESFCDLIDQEIKNILKENG